MESDGLKRVLNAYVNYAFEDQINEHPSEDEGKNKNCHGHDAPRFTIYDQLYQIINEELENLDLPKPVLVSWLNEEDVEKAINELATAPNISSIKNQYEEIDANYPEVHFDYFQPKEKAPSDNNNNQKEIQTAKYSKRHKLKLE